MATIGKPPQNQLNALPLLDADVVAAGGVIQIVGGGIARFFDANTLQINGINMTSFAGGLQIAVVTPYLNLTGCNKGLITLRVSTTVVRVALPSIFLFAQYRQGPSDTPAVVYDNGGGDQQLANGYIQLSSTGRIFPATNAANQIQTGAYAWAPGDPTSSGPSSFNTIGADVRFILGTNGSPLPGVLANHFFTAFMWASS